MGLFLRGAELIADFLDGCVGFLRRLRGVVALVEVVDGRLVADVPASPDHACGDAEAEAQCNLLGGADFVRCEADYAAGHCGIGKRGEREMESVGREGKMGKGCVAQLLWRR